MSFELPVMDPCHFCAVIRGEAEAWNVIAEDELTVTMLNGRQFEVGQCIVMPVRHAPTLLDLSEPEADAIMKSARRLMQVMMDEFAPDGVLLYQNNGVGSGQEVPHFHLHVVPRQPGSDWGFGPPHIARLEHHDKSGKFDHAAVTDHKLRTVDRLRSYFP